MTLAARGVSVPGRVGCVTAALEPGTVTAICGPNGAGKSTLLQTLAGLIAPAAGAVTLDGAPLSALTPRARGRAVGYLPQTTAIAWDVPVRRIVELGRLPHGDTAAAPVQAAMAALGIAALAERRAQALSGGETARVALARVLAGEPRWILADEPLAALDLSHQLALLAHLRAAAVAGAGVVLVIHDLALAMNHADRVLVLDGGRLASDGPPPLALNADVIARVWRVTARWHGAKGEQALSASLPQSPAA